VFLSRSDERTPSPPRLPRGLRLYVVGDIHGRADLLDRIHELIALDARGLPERVCHIVYLGDYIDRGGESPAVLDRLSDGPPPGFGVIHLKGNHDEAMLRFLGDIRVGPQWVRFGGLATLAAYGIERPSRGTPVERLEAIQSRLRAVLPQRHFDFLRGLRPRLGVGDYLFVHAGVRPGVPLDRQNERDLLWIREEFLNAGDDFGKIVVHGHSIVEQPDVRPNRIGIDTGAFVSNRLTCLVLEDAERRFLVTG
jgi:serine/threonine protein phosphatase 1